MSIIYSANQDNFSVSSSADSLALPRTLSGNGLDNWLTGESMTKSCPTAVFGGNDLARGIMDPVLKEKPQSYWLVKQAQQEKVVEEKAANLTTSLWLASTSTSSLTCQTMASSKSAIEWPSHLRNNSFQQWLCSEQTKGKTQQAIDDDLQDWLLCGGDNTEVKTTNCLFDYFATVQGSDFQNWLLSSGKSPIKSSSDIEKWLEAAAKDFDLLEIGASNSAMTAKNNEDEEDESIAVLSCSDFDSIAADQGAEVMEISEDYNVWLF